MPRFSGSVIYNYLPREFTTSLCFLSSVPELIRTRGSWSERINVDVSACELMRGHEAHDESVLETLSRERGESNKRRYSSGRKQKFTDVCSRST